MLTRRTGRIRLMVLLLAPSLIPWWIISTIPTMYAMYLVPQDLTAGAILTPGLLSTMNAVTALTEDIV